MPSRLKHESVADPVEFGQEMRALVQHGFALQWRRSPRNDSDRVSAGVPINTEKSYQIKKLDNDYHLLSNLDSSQPNYRIEYGGSLDASRIREIAKSIGIILNESHYNVEKHGKVLINIKSYRNDLAHGKKSFSDIGKDVTFNGLTSLDENEKEKINELGLRHFKEYTIEHLESFIVNIKDFIENEKYLLAS